jgi:hypothetical protein
MKYSGKVGFATQVETSPGVWDDTIVEKDYIGDVVQRTERLDNAESITPRYRTTTSFSVLADAVLNERRSDIRYIRYKGVAWAVSSVILKYPRMEMYIDEEYNGPTA